jgi:hypothetical protein
MIPDVVMVCWTRNRNLLNKSDALTSSSGKRIRLVRHRREISENSDLTEKIVKSVIRRTDTSSIWLRLSLTKILRRKTDREMSFKSIFVLRSLETVIHIYLQLPLNLYTSRRFHQRFFARFFRTSFRQLFLVTFRLCQKFCTKNARVKEPFYKINLCCVATSVLCMRLLHVVAFSKKLPWLAQTK